LSDWENADARVTTTTVVVVVVVVEREEEGRCRAVLACRRERTQAGRPAKKQAR
jgi:hypothetical protein